MPNQPAQPTNKLFAPKNPKKSKKRTRPESVHAKKLISKGQVRKILMWVTLVIVLALLVYAGYTLYKLASYQPIVEREKVELYVDPKIKKQIRSSIHHGESLSPAEGGVGRENPFVPY